MTFRLTPPAPTVKRRRAAIAPTFVGPREARRPPIQMPLPFVDYVEVVQASDAVILKPAPRPKSGVDFDRARNVYNYLRWLGY